MCQTVQILSEELVLRSGSCPPPLPRPGAEAHRESVRAWSVGAKELKERHTTRTQHSTARPALPA
ncbi:Protein of unknown function [Gryllus bimaculatus]|nr:Protein of unknown function [Gryllus bimaculatus]